MDTERGDMPFADTLLLAGTAVIFKFLNTVFVNTSDTLLLISWSSKTQLHAFSPLNVSVKSERR